MGPGLGRKPWFPWRNHGKKVCVEGFWSAGFAGCEPENFKNALDKVAWAVLFYFAENVRTRSSKLKVPSERCRLVRGIGESES